MTAIAYTQPLAADESDGKGLVVRRLDKYGQLLPPLTAQGHSADWRSDFGSIGNVYTGEGYILARPASLDWLSFVFRLMVAESLHVEHATAREKARDDRRAAA